MDLPQQVFVLKYLINLPRVEELQKIHLNRKNEKIINPFCSRQNLVLVSVAYFETIFPCIKR